MEGSGSIVDPWKIRSAEELAMLGLGDFFWDRHYVLMNDIDLSSVHMTVIGYSYVEGFEGSFDGNGYTLSNLKVELPAKDMVGMFGYVGESGELRNVILEGADVSGRFYVGGLAGYSGGSITNCIMTGRVRGEDYVGGVLGRNSKGIVQKCHSEGTVFGDYRIGGLVGYSGDGMIVESSAASSVSGLGSFGGLAGSSSDSSTIENCYSIGTVSGESSVGGLVGYHYRSNIARCYASGTVEGVEHVGGLVGYDWYGSYGLSFWDSDVNPSIGGVGSLSEVGGVMGITSAKMKRLSTYAESGWDFLGEDENGTEDVWTICDGMNYPRFVWQINPYDFYCPDGVGIEELMFLCDFWLENRLQPFAGPDVTGDGSVDMWDFGVLGSHWGEE
jgi:hypothetical protein